MQIIIIIIIIIIPKKGHLEGWKCITTIKYAGLLMVKQIYFKP